MTKGTVQYWILLIIMGAALLAIACSAVGREPQADAPRNLNEEPGFNASQQLALQIVMDSYQYREYGPSDLRLTQVEHDTRCAGCWSFVYAFDVNSSLAPAHVKAIAIRVEIIDGEVQNTRLTEIPK